MGKLGDLSQRDEYIRMYMGMATAHWMCRAAYSFRSSPEHSSPFWPVTLSA